MISAIVVSYNSRQLLPACLESLIDEGAEELIVVDNASSDGSLEVAATAFPTARTLALGDNLGFGAACNRGAETARGDLLLFLNPDARLGRGALNALRDAFAEPRLGAAAAQLRYPDGSLQFSWGPEKGVVGEALQKCRNRWERQMWNHRLLPLLLKPLTGPGWYCAACLMVRRRAFEAISGFDEGFFLYFEDVDLTRRLQRSGWTIRIPAGAEAMHVGGASDGGRSEVEYRRAQLRYYRQHRGAWENRYILWRLARRARCLGDPAQRQEMLEVIDEAEARWRARRPH